ncbi:hypothetical protein BaRGS_00034982 [Batillaria attramentaria]|uniref:Uncharacterized protein n=1 Tax=Batillaria attramentaria TaxID=370345 RepID=A0ABD0JG64_9CAEN
MHCTYATCCCTDRNDPVHPSYKGMARLAANIKRAGLPGEEATGPHHSRVTDAGSPHPLVASDRSFASVVINRADPSVPSSSDSGCRPITGRDTVSCQQQQQQQSLAPPASATQQSSSQPWQPYTVHSGYLQSPIQWQDYPIPAPLFHYPQAVAQFHPYMAPQAPPPHVQQWGHLQNPLRVC